MSKIPVVTSKRAKRERPVFTPKRSQKILPSEPAINELPTSKSNTPLPKRDRAGSLTLNSQKVSLNCKQSIFPDYHAFVIKYFSAQSSSKIPIVRSNREQPASCVK